MSIAKGMYTIGAVALLTVLGLPSFSQGGTVKLTWAFPETNVDGSPLTDLAGAKIYYGTSSSNYTTVIDAGYVTAFTVTGMVEGATYYFNGTAYNTGGLESDFSHERAKVATVDAGDSPLLTNQAPQVNAGPDIHVTLPDSARLQGSAVDDGLPEGSTLTTIWSSVSGPDSVVFGDATALETTASFSAAGDYVLQLSASDGEKTGTDLVTVNVAPVSVPQPPRNLRIFQ